MPYFYIIILHFLEETIFVRQCLYILIDLKIRCFLWRNLLGMERGITVYEEEQNSVSFINEV